MANIDKDIGYDGYAEIKRSVQNMDVWRVASNQSSRLKTEKTLGNDVILQLKICTIQTRK